MKRKNQSHRKQRRQERAEIRRQEGKVWAVVNQWDRSRNMLLGTYPECVEYVDFYDPNHNHLTIQYKG